MALVPRKSKLDEILDGRGLPNKKSQRAKDLQALALAKQVNDGKPVIRAKAGEGEFSYNLKAKKKNEDN